MANFNTVPNTSPSKPEPFTLHVSDTDLTEFHQLLKLSKIGPSTWWNQQTDGRFGVSREWLSQAKEAWLKTFDWRAHEAQINSVPNFKITIHDDEAGDVPIHFAALFSNRNDAVPVLFLHGYPGSFMEFLPMMRLLAEKYTPETLPYHVIVPSLPDYGLSGGGSENIEMTLDRAARIMNQLMVDLGFDGYIAQGGDLGSMLARMMSEEYKECKALHINMLVLNTDETPPAPETHDIKPQEAEHLERTERWRETGFAYALEHGTRPSTIGLVVSSNPLALLAWIGEKHLEWTDPRRPLPLDTILAMTSLYWFTSTFPRGLYHAALVKNFLAGRRHPITKEKPLGYSQYQYDMAMLPESWAREIYPNLVLFRRHTQGGHFAALEMPGAFLDDVEAFIGRVRNGLK